MNDNLTMDQLRIGTEHKVGDVQDLALLIVDPDRKGLRAGDCSQKTADSLLAGCILHLSYKAKVEGSRETFGALEEMWPASAGQSNLSALKCSPTVHINGENHPVVSTAALDCLTNEADSVL